MSNLFKYTKRVLTSVLAAAVVLTAIPSTAFGAELDEDLAIEVQDTEVAEAGEEVVVENEEAETTDGASEEEVIVEGGEETPDTAYVQRLLAITPANNDQTVTYGNAITDATFTAAASKSGVPVVIDKIGYQFKKLKAGKTDDDVTTALATDDATAIALLDDMSEADFKEATGLDVTLTGLVLKISGTPIKKMDDTRFYIVISDLGGQSDDLGSRALDKLTHFDLEVNGLTISESSEPARWKTWSTNPFSAKGVAFGAGLKSNVTTVVANEGYTTDETKDPTSKLDNVIPVKITLGATIESSKSDKVKAEIIAYDKADADTNTNAVVKSGAEAIAAYTVTPSVTAENLSTSNSAVFTISPVRGLKAKQATGTKYLAKLKLTSNAFGEMEIPLGFTVTSELGIESVKAHGGADATGNGSAGNPYDLGDFKVGESINDVVITAKGGTGTLSFTANTDSAAGFSAFPASLSPDTATAKTYKLIGKVAPSATAYTLTTARVFTLTVKDSGSGASTDPIYFQYHVVSADTEMGVNKGAYDAKKATEITAGSPNFTWSGANDATLANEYATFKITNKSEENLKYVLALTASKGEFTVDPEVATTTGLTVQAGKDATFKLIPKSVDGTSKDTIATYTLTAPGVTTTTGTFTYNQLDTLTITKPAADNTDIGPATVGKAFSYTFEETHPSSVKSVVWSIGTIKDGDNNDVTEAELKNTYGLSFNNGTIEGTLKAVAPATSTNPHTFTAVVTATPSTGAPVARTIKISTAKPAGLALSYNGKEIKAAGSANQITMPGVTIDGISTAEAEISVTNKTLIEQKGIKASVTAVTKGGIATSSQDEFTVIYDKDDATRDSALASAGLTLATEETGKFYVVPSDTLTAAGEYVATVSVAGTSLDAQTFTTKLVVKDAPVISVPKVNDSGNGSYDPDYYQVGKELAVPAGSDLSNGVMAYKAVYTAGSTESANQNQFDYALVEGSIPGLTFNTKGYFTGTPTKSGVYKLKISATTNALTGPEVTGYVEHEVTVTGTTMSVVTEGSVNVKNKTYLLTSKAAGYTANTSALILAVKATDAEKPLTGLAVAAPADADDDRLVNEDLDADGIADRIKSPANPYLGSASYFTATLNKATASTTDGATLTIGLKAGAPAGFYKAKFAVTADNASEVDFEVAFAVVGKLTIALPASATVTVGQSVKAGDIRFTATGGDASQVIAWTEVPAVVGGVNKYYVTASGTAGSSSSTTNLRLLGAAGKNIGYTDNEGVMTDVVTDSTDKVKGAGTFPVTIAAGVAAGAYTTETPRVIGGGSGVAGILGMIGRAGAGNVIGDKANAIPAQTADNKTFSLTVSKSSNPQVTGLQVDALTPVAPSDENAKGKFIGNKWLSISEYTYKAPAGYAAAEALKVTVSDSNNGGLNVKATLSDNDRFTLSDADEKAISDTGYTWTITPSAGLSAGSYPCEVTFEGDDVATIPFKFTFVVEPKSWKITLDNNIAPDAADTSKRVEYCKEQAGGTNNNPVVLTKTIEELDKPVATTGADKPFAVRNSGNTQLYSVKVTEVKKSGNIYVATTDPILSIGGTLATATDIAAGANKTFTLTNAKTTKQNTTAYIDIEYKDSALSTAKTYEIIVPVAVVVVSGSVEGLTITPGTTEGATVTMKSVNEGYKPADAELEFTLTNTNTDAADMISNVAWTNAVLSGTDAGKFAVVAFDPADADAANIAAGKNIKAKVRPIEGLPAGTYKATVTFNAANLKAAQTRVISFTVGEAKLFDAALVTTSAATATIEDDSIAGKLYNTLIKSGVKSANGAKIAAQGATDGNTKRSVLIDLDSSATATLTTANSDVEVAFVGTGLDSDTAPTTVTEASIKILAGNTIQVNSKTIELSASEITKAKAGDTKCFEGIKFNLYNKVEFTAGLFKEKTADLESFNENVIAGGTDTTPGSKTIGQATTGITAFIPMGNTLGSVFKGGVLPTPVIANTAVAGWKDAAGVKYAGTTKIVGDHVGTGAGELVPDATTYTYPADGAKDGSAGVKWTWTNNNGNVDAVLVLTDTSGKYDADSAIEVTKSSKTGTTYPTVKTAVTITDKGSQPATCTTGSSKKLEATAAVAFASGGADDRTYTATYALDEQDDALGHNWLAPVVTWTDKDTDGRYTKDEVTVTRTCGVCGETVALTVVSVNETVAVEPTCTKPGQAKYSVTYTDVDKFGKPAGNVTDTENTKESEIKPLGHDYKLEVEWNEDHKTAKKATLVCSRCKDDEPGHSVDVTASVTYKIETDPSTGEVMTAQAIYHAGEKDEVKSDVWYSHQHKWGKPTWYWEGPTKAIATFTCSVKGEKVTKEATPTFVKENGRGDKQYIAAVVGPDDKQYSDTQWYDKNGNPTSGEGIGIEGIEEEYNYTGKAIKPEPTVIDYGADKVLVKGTDYTVSYKDNKNVGTATITVKGKGNYGEKGGEIQKTFKIIDPIGGEKPEDFSVVKSIKKSSEKLYYNGEAQAPATLTIKTNGADLVATWNKSAGEYEFETTPEKEVKIFVTNNVNKGTGLIAVHGIDTKGKWTVKTTTFSIKACEMDNGDNFTVTASDAVWGVKGAIPEVEVSYMSTVLTEGVDYTLSFKNNKKIGENVAQVIVKGKGNFTKKNDAAKFTVNPFEITEIKDITAYDGLKRSKVAVTITDPYGNIVPAKNYTVTASGTGDKLVKGESIDVTVTGKTSEVTGSQTEANYEIGTNLAKVKVTVPKTFYKQYEGKAVELTDEDFGSGKIQVGDLTYGTDFQITRYQNNTKKGTMTVYIVGVSEKASGIGKFKVKITPAKIKPAE